MILVASTVDIVAYIYIYIHDDAHSHCKLLLEQLLNLSYIKQSHRPLSHFCFQYLGFPVFSFFHFSFSNTQIVSTGNL